ncbi:MAG TPA: isochorismatase family cysteine hydrolase [Chloroflexota bacterium]|jgi:ureidoacrylate peracid hydrolase
MSNTEFSAVTLEELVDTKTTALVVVDMQNDFCHSEGALARNRQSPVLIQAMAPRLRALLASARETGTSIVHVRTHHSPWTNSPAWTRRKLGAMSRCFPNSWGADWYEGFEPILDDAWSPETHEYVVTKHRYSAFWDTDMDLILRSHGIQSLIMTGEATNVCVETTARDAYMRDYSIVFVSDGTATYSEAVHEATLHNMSAHFGIVVDSDEIVAAWRKLGVLKEPVAV